MGLSPSVSYIALYTRWFYPTKSLVTPLKAPYLNYTSYTARSPLLHHRTSQTAMRCQLNLSIHLPPVYLRLDICPATLTCPIVLLYPPFIRSYQHYPSLVSCFVRFLSLLSQRTCLFVYDLQAYPLVPPLRAMHPKSQHCLTSIAKKKTPFKIQLSIILLLDTKCAGPQPIAIPAPTTSAASLAPVNILPIPTIRLIDK